MTAIRKSGVLSCMLVYRAGQMTVDAKWNLGELIKDLGGPARVRELLLAQGMKVPKLTTVYAWSREARSPAAGVALIVALARKVDPGFDVMRYLDTTDKDAA